jgi:hypothetical protein
MLLFYFSFETAFPPHLREEAKRISKMFKKENLISNVGSGVTTDYVEYRVDGYTVSFPYRIYFNEISDEQFSSCSETEQRMLHCLFTRSCDGYVREKHIKALLSERLAEWEIPFIIKCSDEYVVQIVELIYDALKNENNDMIKAFCRNNQMSFCKSYSRMISYWNEFYRYECYKYKNYIGRKLFHECYGYVRSMEKFK